MESRSLHLEEIPDIIFTGVGLSGFCPAPDGRILFSEKNSSVIRVITREGTLSGVNGYCKMSDFSFSPGKLSDDFTPSIKKIFFLNDKIVCIGRFQEGGIAFFDQEGHFLENFAARLRQCIGFGDVFSGATVLGGRHLFCFGEIPYDLHQANNVFIDVNFDAVTPNIIKDYTIIEAMALDDGQALAVAHDRRGKTKILVLNERRPGLIEHDLTKRFKYLAPAINLKASPIISVCPDGLIFCKVGGHYFDRYATPGLVVLNRDLTLNNGIMRKLERIYLQFGKDAVIHPKSRIAHLFGKRFLAYHPDNPDNSLKLFDFEKQQSDMSFQRIPFPRLNEEGEFDKKEIEFCHFMPEIGKTLVVLKLKKINPQRTGDSDKLLFETKFFWTTDIN